MWAGGRPAGGSNVFKLSREGRDLPVKTVKIPVPSAKPPMPARTVLVRDMQIDLSGPCYYGVAQRIVRC